MWGLCNVVSEVQGANGRAKGCHSIVARGRVSFSINLTRVDLVPWRQSSNKMAAAALELEHAQAEVERQRDLLEERRQEVIGSDFFFWFSFWFVLFCFFCLAIGAGCFVGYTTRRKGKMGGGCRGSSTSVFFFGGTHVCLNRTFWPVCVVQRRKRRFAASVRSFRRRATRPATRFRFADMAFGLPGKT